MWEKAHYSINVIDSKMKYNAGHKFVESRTHRLNEIFTKI